MSSDFLSAIWLFAQDAPAAAPAAGRGGSPMDTLLSLAPLVLIFVVFYMLMIRPEKRKQAEHKSLLESLKKNDRVVTIGGIYGVVANVQRDADRVTLKVDETNNTKIDVTYNSISRVISGGAEEESK